VGKESNAWTTHPLLDLTLKAAGRWKPRFSQITFGLQLMDTLCFKVLYLLICSWIIGLFCHLLAFPAEKVWHHTVSVYPSDSPSDSPCIIYIVCPDVGSHEVAVHKTTASGRMCCPCERHTIEVMQSVETPLFHDRFSLSCCCCCCIRSNGIGRDWQECTYHCLLLLIF